MLYDQNWDKKIEQTERWRQILLDGADIIEREGWGRRHYRYNGNYCAVGAMMKASGVDFDGPFPTLFSMEKYPGLSAAIVYLRQHCGNHPVTTWNDFIVKDGNEVVAKMREVART